MSNLSVAGVGMYSHLVVLLFSFVGVQVDVIEADNLLMALLTIITFVTWVVGQVRRKDLTAGLKRK